MDTPVLRYSRCSRHTCYGCTPGAMSAEKTSGSNVGEGKELATPDHPGPPRLPWTSGLGPCCTGGWQQQSPLPMYLDSSPDPLRVRFYPTPTQTAPCQGLASARASWPTVKSEVPTPVCCPQSTCWTKSLWVWTSAPCPAPDLPRVPQSQLPQEGPPHVPVCPGQSSLLCGSSISTNEQCPLSLSKVAELRHYIIGSP